MSPDELYNLIRKALEEGVTLDAKSILILICIAIFFSALAYFISYLKSKGKNLATKEDIETITDKIESVKSDYAQKLESIAHENKMIRDQLHQRHEMKLAALDKRLAVHQEAYTLWWEMMGKANKKDERGDFIIKCQNWYVNNSLYLTKESRNAFHDAYMAADIHPDLLRDRVSAKELKENFNKILRAGQILVEAVSLPSLGENEYSPIKDINERKG
jgi:hypothetical protein